jgi:hypothetical protein
MYSGGVHRPPTSRTIADVGHQDGTTGLEGVDARSFPENELQILQPFGGDVGCGRHATDTVLGHHAHARSGTGQGRGRRPAQATQVVDHSLAAGRDRLRRDQRPDPGHSISSVIHGDHGLAIPDWPCAARFSCS